ncbi:hypothetical protein L6R52_12230 [Myxococcota bacterium]|nr:hypothetical protein [Myxococcota bacterium]
MRKRSEPIRRSYLEQSNDRHLPADYRGDILLWDIDKTYLDTRFSSMRGLLSIPFELAIDKRAIPGAVPLLRALRHGPAEKTALVPLYFISGSPFQLRKVIERKMTIDGVEWDGLTFKDQLGLLLDGKPGLIRAQLGYKLKAMLLYRLTLPKGARWMTFGDDVEEDADSFLLFGRVAGGFSGRPLEIELVERGVASRDVAEILELAEGAASDADPVDRVFIHLEKGSDPSRFRDPRVVATRSYLQTAMVLATMGRVRRDAVTAVAKDLRRRLVPEASISEHSADAERRLAVPTEIADLARAR